MKSDSPWQRYINGFKRYFVRAYAARYAYGAFGYLLLIFFFLGSRVLAPLHIPIAFVCFIMFGFRMYQFYNLKYIRHNVEKLGRRTWKQLLARKVLFLSGLFVVLGLYTYVALIPNDEEVFSNLSEQEIKAKVDEDLVHGAQLIDLLVVSAEQLLQNEAIHKDVLTIDEQESLKADWNNFLGVAIASEEITDIHRYFPQIPLLTMRDLQVQSFIISYALYMKKFEYFHKIIEAVGNNQNVRLILNEHVPAFGQKNSYNDVVSRYLASNSFLRRNVGYLYYKVMTPDEKTVSNEYRVLLESAKQSYQYVFSNIFSQVTYRSISLRQTIGDGINDTWMPVQKTVFVDTIGNIHVGDRKEKFITEKDINQMKAALLPGDIFLARKNWYASNVGIPGFWTHAGIYTGTLKDMREYFSPLFPYTDSERTYVTFDSMLEQKYPTVYATYSEVDENGHERAIIESETLGTSIHSLEYTAKVDYFGVMRTNLSREDIMKSLLRSFAHDKKPYDYEFSLVTKDEIFCSELVFDTFIPTANKGGVTFPRSVISGRELVAPNDILKKFVEERETDSAELTFVYFLDGNEETKEAMPANEEAFVDSFARAKFSFFLE